jgi:thioester reductase-like protein
MLSTVPRPVVAASRGSSDASAPRISGQPPKQEEGTREVQLEDEQKSGERKEEARQTGLPKNTPAFLFPPDVVDPFDPANLLQLHGESYLRNFPQDRLFFEETGLASVLHPLGDGHSPSSRSYFPWALEQHVLRRTQELCMCWVDSKGRDQRPMTWGEFWIRANHIAQLLIVEHRCAPLEPIILCDDFGLDFICGFVGCMIAGVLAVPVYPPNPAALTKALHKLRETVRSCGATKAIVGSKLNNFRRIDLMHSWPQLTWIPMDGKASITLPMCFPVEPSSEAAAAAAAASSGPSAPLARASSSRPSWQRGFSASATDLLFLQYTSGSTSSPKGVQITHGNMYAHCRDSASHMFSHRLRNSGEGRAACNRGLGIQQDVIVSWLPPFHDMGLAGMHLTQLLAGIPGYYFSPIAFIGNPSLWPLIMSRVRCSYTGCPNFGLEVAGRKWKAELAPADFDLSSICIICGGEPIRKLSVDAFEQAFAPYGYSSRRNLSPAYGLAEHVAGAVTRWDWSGDLMWSRLQPQLVSCGPMRMFDVTVLIVDPETRREVVQEGGVGEIWVTSLARAQGYHGLPDVSAATFGQELASVPREPHHRGKVWMRSGDLAFCEDRHLFVCGRLKDMLCCAGEKYYAQDLEYASEQSSKLVRPGGTAVFAVLPDELTAAVAAPKPASSPDPALKWLRGALLRHRDEICVVCVELRENVRVKDAAGWSALCQAIRAGVAGETGANVEVIVFLPTRTLPKTSSGKIQRKLSKAMLIEAMAFQKTALHVWYAGANLQAAPEASPAAASRSAIPNSTASPAASSSGPVHVPLALDREQSFPRTPLLTTTPAGGSSPSVATSDTLALVRDNLLPVMEYRSASDPTKALSDALHEEEREVWLAVPTAEEMALPSSSSSLPPGRRAADHFPHWRNVLSSKGWMGMLIPRQYGGGGLSPQQTLANLRRLVPLGLQQTQVAAYANGLSVWSILQHGSEEVKQMYLPGLATGVHYASFCMSEPHRASSNLAGMETEATPTVRADGAHGYLLQGTKYWIFATIHASLFIVFAACKQTEQHAAATAGDTAPANEGDRMGFIVDRNWPGVRVLLQPAGGAAHLPLSSKGEQPASAPEATESCQSFIGLENLFVGGVSFEQVFVPQSHTLPFFSAYDSMMFARLVIGEVACATMDHVQSICQPFIEARTLSFGQPMAQHPDVLRQWARVGAEKRILRRVLDVCTELLQKPPNRLPYILPVALKIYAPAALQRCIDTGMQLLGAYGVSVRSQLPDLSRHSRISRIYEGTEAVMAIYLHSALSNIARHPAAKSLWKDLQASTNTRATEKSMRFSDADIHLLLDKLSSVPTPSAGVSTSADLLFTLHSKSVGDFASSSNFSRWPVSSDRGQALAWWVLRATMGESPDDLGEDSLRLLRSYTHLKFTRLWQEEVDETFLFPAHLPADPCDPVDTRLIGKGAAEGNLANEQRHGRGMVRADQPHLAAVPLPQQSPMLDSVELCEDAARVSDTPLSLKLMGPFALTFGVALTREQFGVDENVFDNGLTSLRATTLVSQLHGVVADVLGTGVQIELSAIDLFENPTARALAGVIAMQLGPHQPPVSQSVDPTHATSAGSDASSPGSAHALSPPSVLSSLPSSAVHLPSAALKSSVHAAFLTVCQVFLISFLWLNMAFCFGLSYWVVDQLPVVTANTTGSLNDGLRNSIWLNATLQVCIFTAMAPITCMLQLVVYRWMVLAMLFCCRVRVAAGFRCSGVLAYAGWWYLDRHFEIVKFFVRPLLGTDLLALYLRLLGAQIGKNVWLHSLEVDVLSISLLTVEDDAVIGHKVSLKCVTVNHHTLDLDFAPIHIGACCVLEERTFCHPGASLGARSYTHPFSAIKGSVVPFSVWQAEDPIGTCQPAASRILQLDSPFFAPQSAEPPADRMDDNNEKGRYAALCPCPPLPRSWCKRLFQLVFLGALVVLSSQCTVLLIYLYRRYHTYPSVSAATAQWRVTYWLFDPTLDIRNYAFAPLWIAVWTIYRWIESAVVVRMHTVGVAACMPRNVARGIQAVRHAIQLSEARNSQHTSAASASVDSVSLALSSSTCRLGSWHYLLESWSLESVLTSYLVNDWLMAATRTHALWLWAAGASMRDTASALITGPLMGHIHLPLCFLHLGGDIALTDLSLGGTRIERGYMILAPVMIGDGVIGGSGAMIQAGSIVPTGFTVAPNTFVPFGQKHVQVPARTDAHKATEDDVDAVHIKIHAPRPSGSIELASLAPVTSSPVTMQLSSLHDVSEAQPSLLHASPAHHMPSHSSSEKANLSLAASQQAAEERTSPSSGSQTLLLAGVPAYAFRREIYKRAAPLSLTQATAHQTKLPITVHQLAGFALWLVASGLVGCCMLPGLHAAHAAIQQATDSSSSAAPIYFFYLLFLPVPFWMSAVLVMLLVVVLKLALLGRSGSASREGKLPAEEACHHTRSPYYLRHLFVHACLMQSVYIRFLSLCFSGTVLLNRFIVWLGADLQWDTHVTCISNIPVPRGVRVGYGCTLHAASCLSSARVQDGVLVLSSLQCGHHVTLQAGSVAIPGTSVSSCTSPPPSALLYDKQYSCEHRDAQRVREDVSHLWCGLGEDVDLSASAVDVAAALQGAPPDDKAAPGVEHILLTGATGFLGAQLAMELLTSKPRCILHVLVRGQSNAFSRLLKELQERQLWQHDFLHRIVVVRGSLQQPRLGLPLPEYLRLCGLLDSVFHCAARVHWLHSYAALREPNVIGTIHVIRMAHTAQKMKQRVVHFHYISTVAAAYSCLENGDSDVWSRICRYRSRLAAASNSGVSVPPIDLIDGLCAAHDAIVRLQHRSGMAGYASSKWMGELLLHSAAAEGFRCPISIYRPSLIAPHHVSAHCKGSDFVPRLLLSAVQLGCQLDSADALDCISIDAAAKLIVCVARAVEERGPSSCAAAAAAQPTPASVLPSASVDSVRSYHITSGQFCPLFSTVPHLLSQTRWRSRVRPVSFIEWVDTIEAYGGQGAMFTLLHFMREQAPRQAPLDMTNVRRALFGHGNEAEQAAHSGAGEEDKPAAAPPAARRASLLLASVPSPSCVPDFSSDRSVLQLLGDRLLTPFNAAYLERILKRMESDAEP